MGSPKRLHFFGDGMIKDSQFPKTATELRSNLVRNELSLDEVVHHQETLLNRHKELNAIVEVCDLTNLESEVKSHYQGAYKIEQPLFGVPISVKDIIAVKGLHLTAGSLLLRENIAQIDAPVVQRAKHAGGFIVGKTNCPEFAFGVGTSNKLFGTTYNPLNMELSPGGSSGGEAVSVAIGTSLIGVGSDYGGSIRWPAQCLGILGIRPTPGRIPSMGQIPGVGSSGCDGESLYPRTSLQSALQVPGFLARSVADLDLAITATYGYHYSDPTSVPMPAGPIKNIESTELTVAWSDGTSLGPVDSEIVAAISSLANLLADIGLRVIELPDMFKGAREAFDELRDYDELSEVRRLAKGQEEMLTDGLRSILSKPLPSRDGYSKAYERAMSQRKVALETLKKHPICLLPVAGASAMDHNNRSTIGSLEISGFDLMAHCRAVSLIGAPVVSMPIAKSKQGMPISVQVVAQPWQESQMLAFASLLEQLGFGWQQILPDS